MSMRSWARRLFVRPATRPIRKAPFRARLTLEGVTGFDVQHVSGVLEGSRVSYRVELRVWFTLLERMHG